MRNIEELVERLLEVFNDRRADKPLSKRASMQISMVGKVISMFQLELEYYIMRESNPETPAIDFLETGFEETGFISKENLKQLEYLATILNSHREWMNKLSDEVATTIEVDAVNSMQRDVEWVINQLKKLLGN